MWYDGHGPGLDAMGLYRQARRAHLQGIPLLPRVLQRIAFHLYGCYLPYQAEIGEGTVLGYGGMGVVIHKDCKVGRYCLISQQVTLGGRSGRRGLPVLGDYVRVGAGAKILGDITIGNFAVIGANAVVTRDVPPGAVMAGVPARELRRDPDPWGTLLRDLGASNKLSIPPTVLSS
jgi:serine O-acetyltransferase